MSTAFDVTGPLPTGVAVLEASAGTGKTYTIAALAARYVADGVPLQQLLVVSFTRAATGELRERVRERLVGAERALDTVLAGLGLGAADEVTRALTTGPPDALALRRERLARAVADFDAATITTTHGFCHEALDSLGFDGDLPRDCELVEDVSDLVTEVVDDLYVRRFLKHSRAFDRAEAGRIAQAAIANPGAVLVPEDVPEDSVRAMRVRLAERARAELDARKQAASILTFDDLLTHLDDALAGPSGATVAARLRARYRVVLVDEFQDTDPVQWRILERAFRHPDCALVLIGDPKQAIYSFRGADVFAYLRAAQIAGTHATLEVNRRSDQRLLDAYDGLFGDAQLGHEQIAYLKVRASPEHQDTGLRGSPQDAPLRVRVVDRETPSLARTRGGFVTKDAARQHIAEDLAADVVRLLESGATLPGGGAVRPGDVAVLVRRNVDAALVRERLEAAGVPAVINGAGSVFASPAASTWLALLEALERPSSSPRVRAAALTPLVGWSAPAIAGADDAAWEVLHDRLHAWAALLREAGVAALAEAITLQEALPARVLAQPDGERELTDLRHVAQLLHVAATEDALGVAALTAWLRRRIAQAETEADEERSRRLESDAAAVQVLTIHRSKGLEFPIVYCPGLWTIVYRPDRDHRPVLFHDARHDDRRTLDVGLEGTDYDEHVAAAEREERGEDLRLAYVALTRARHQAVLWWVGVKEASQSALGRLVFARQASGAVPAYGRALPSDAEARERFAALAPGCLVVEDAALAPLRQWSGEARATAALRTATWSRELDRAWRRTSYSDITADRHDAPRADEPDTRLVDDEPDVDPDLLAPDAPARAMGAAAAAAGEAGEAGSAEEAGSAGEAGGAGDLLLAGMPGGTRVGTLVHDLLEAADFAPGDLRAEVGARLAEAQARRPVDVGEPGRVADGLTRALQTPLGPLAGGLALSDVPRAGRLDELGFELPLAAPGAPLDPGAIGALLRERLQPGDPLHAYADRLDDPGLRTDLRGYLTGSIDLALRLPDGTWAIVDYKTNRLGDPTLPLTAADYAPGALRAEMLRSDYALQALLYTVALHRYLRWRAPGARVGAVFYCFLRGMTGAPGAGVFGWAPPEGLAPALSDLLDRGGRA